VTNVEDFAKTLINSKAREEQRLQAWRERNLARRRGEAVIPFKLHHPKRPKLAGKTHLVIGDPHAEPEVPNVRFDALGSFIAKLKPDVIVNIGDNWSLDSLLSFSIGQKGSRSYEGKRLIADLEAGIDALERVNHSIHRENQSLKKRGKPAYKPRKIFCIGNHEDRLTRLVEYEPRLEHVISLDDLMLDELGWETVPFEERLEVDGISYCHHFTSTRRMSAAKFVASSALSKRAQPVVFGHTHRRDFFEILGPNRTRIPALNAGCFFEHGMAYAHPQETDMWWRGLVMLHNVHDGQFDPEFVSMPRVFELA